MSFKKHMVLTIDLEGFTTLCGISSDRCSEIFHESPDNLVDYGSAEVTCLHCEREYLEQLNSHTKGVKSLYRWWLRRFFSQPEAEFCSQTARVWLRYGELRRMYSQGYTPEQAAGEILPF